MKEELESSRNTLRELEHEPVNSFRSFDMESKQNSSSKKNSSNSKLENKLEKNKLENISNSIKTINLDLENYINKTKSRT